ncbi:MAG TPA: TonB-dependent receptor [Gemmatimonadaceae bacterium]|nr:TonB-dependent receptor [Gemmatimonadaceae bacterium]
MRSKIVSGVLALSTFLLGARAQAQDPLGRITGTVREANTGEPIVFATVVVPGTRLGGTSDARGVYTVAGLKAGTYQLRVTRIGYAPQTIADVAVGAGETVTRDVSLTRQAVVLEQQVVIGYGTERREDVTGSIASIGGEDVETRAAPMATLSGALQGKAAGVQVLSSGGLPGGGVSVRVRGSNSISANSEPLYVVDGVPAMQGSASSDPTQNPLVTLNPNDIESIDILKDASATAIYGSRGANGVVLVTTRRGHRGEDVLTFETGYGTQHIAKEISVLNAQQYRTLRNEALVNGLQPTQYTDDQIASAPTYDYQSMILRNAPQRNATATFSGGDDKTRYLLSGNTMDQSGIINGTEFRRYGGRINLDREFNKRLRVGTSITGSRIFSNLSAVENGQLAGNSRGILAAMVFDPALPVRDASGNYNQRALLAEFVMNPVATTNELTDQRNENRLIGNVFGEFDIAKGLRFRSSVAANIWNAYNPGYQPSYIYEGAQYHGRATIWQGQSRDRIYENLLTYKPGNLGPGALDLMGGITNETNTFEWNNIVATNFTVEQPKWNAIGTGSDKPVLTNDISERALISYIGRANYNIADRYLLTVSGRRDGSSVFGANNKWAFFPSGAVAWRVSKEPFMQRFGALNDLKLRLSYGVTGNQAVNPYNSLARLASTFTGIGGVDQVGYAPSDVASNPDLKWETTKQTNAGVDVSFFKNRVTVSSDVYASKTDDLLLTLNAPFTSGFATQLRNIGSVQNRGVEFSLNTLNVTGARFNWRSSFNIAHNQNKVLSIGVGQELIETGGDRWGWALGGNSHIIKPGEPLGTFYGYKVLGLWKEGDLCDLTDPDPTLGCVPGELHIKDVNNDGRITPLDRTILGHADPKFYGGFANNFSYGPFTLDAFMTFSSGNKVLNGSNAFLMNSTGALNERTEVLDRWTPTHTDTDIPRANSNRKTLLYSTLIEDGSFLRLQTLTFGYQLPTRYVSYARIASARLYLTGQNLWIATHYTGFDPEVNSLNGSPASRGVDVGAYPRARSWNFGVTATY